MRYLAFVSVLLLFPTLLAAQSTHSPEIFVRAGTVYLWDDEGRIGSGLLIGGGAGIRLVHGIGIEGLFERHVTDRRFSSSVSFHSTVVGATARILKYVGTSRVQPYAGGGVGMARIETLSEFPGFPSNERRTTSGTLSGFTGVRVAAGRRGFVRPEVELLRAGEHLRIAGSAMAGVGW
jgi:opacity protein-like surface antigen